MTATYEKIATNTLGSNQATVTFSTISGSYTDLRIAMMVKTNVASAVEDLLVRVNGDTSSLYSSTRIYGDGSSAASTRSTSQTGWNQNGVQGATGSTSIFTPFFIDIMNYSNTTTFKTALVRNNPLGTSTSYVMGGVWLYRSTNAITSISFASATGSDIVTGSTFTLYGIKAE
jgi:hypothetical protein